MLKIIIYLVILFTLVINLTIVVLAISDPLDSSPVGVYGSYGAYGWLLFISLCVGFLLAPFLSLKFTEFILRCLHKRFSEKGIEDDK